MTARALPSGSKSLATHPLPYVGGACDWVGKQPGDTSPILYISSLAGNQKLSDTAFTKLTGVTHRCFSYAYAGHTSPMFHARHAKILDTGLENGIRVFMDSGAHSFHRMLKSGKTLALRYKIKKENRKEFVEFLSEKFMDIYAEYIKWMLRTKRNPDFYVTLDTQKDCALIYANTLRLQKLGIKPVSVYHGDSSLDWVKRYGDDGHKLICIGIDSKRIKGSESKHRYYSEIFELTTKLGMSCHGLAVTGDRMVSYPWHCMTDAHEILTKRGWVDKDDIKIGDYVLTLKDKKSYWKPVLKVLRYKVKKADIIDINTAKFKAEITPNHEWDIERRDRHKKVTTLKLKPIDKIPRAATYGEAPKYKKYSNDLVRLVAWVWTEGSIFKVARQNSPIIRLYQSESANPEKCLKIQTILENLQVKFNTHTRARKISNTKKSKISVERIWEISNCDIKSKLVKILSLKRELTFKFILALTPYQLKFFIDTAVSGDGWRDDLSMYHSLRHKNIKKVYFTHFGFSQNSGKSMEAFKLACVLAGIGISVVVKNNKLKTRRVENIRSSILKHYRAGAIKNRKIRKYTGTLWCVEVENNNFMTRCKGSYYWTGNSVDSATHIKAAAFGKIIIVIPERQRMAQVHVSTQYSAFTAYGNFSAMSKSARQDVINTVERNGFSFKMVCEDLNTRIAYNAKALFEAVKANKGSKPWSDWKALV